MGNHPRRYSTHVDLHVCHDEHHIGYLFRSGQISEAEYRTRQETAGCYFMVTGKHRAMESISFFVALREAGLPVILSDADEIVARFDGSDYIGIVPHRITPKYCEGMFPSEYGPVIDFIHVYEEDMEEIGQYITWLPEEDAELI